MFSIATRIVRIARGGISIDQPARDRRKISARGHYILWEDDEAYVVFDQRRPGSAVNKFPRTEAGLLDAEGAMRNLVRADRLAMLRIVLIWGTAVGLVAWMASSVLIGYLEVRRFGQVQSIGSFVGSRSLDTTLFLMWLIRSTKPA